MDGQVAGVEDLSGSNLHNFGHVLLARFWDVYAIYV